MRSGPTIVQEITGWYSPDGYAAPLHCGCCIAGGSRCGALNNLMRRAGGGVSCFFLVIGRSVRGGAVQKTARIAKRSFGDKSDFPPLGGPMVIANRGRLCSKPMQDRNRAGTEAIHHFAGDLFYGLALLNHAAANGVSRSTVPAAGNRSKTACYSRRLGKRARRI